MSSKSMLLIFLMYFSTVIKWRVDATLLVIIISPLLSVQIKSAIISNLMSLSALLILNTYLFESDINFWKLFELIGIMTCLLKGPFVIILSLGLFKTL